MSSRAWQHDTLPRVSRRATSQRMYVWENIFLDGSKNIISNCDGDAACNYSMTSVDWDVILGSPFSFALATFAVVWTLCSLLFSSHSCWRQVQLERESSKFLSTSISTHLLTRCSLLERILTRLLCMCVLKHLFSWQRIFTSWMVLEWIVWNRKFSNTDGKYRNEKCTNCVKIKQAQNLVLKVIFCPLLDNTSLFVIYRRHHNKDG